MRQKRLKYVTMDLMTESGVITEVKKLDIDNFYLEVGSGKGQFLTSLAKDNPNNLYVAMERNIDVCYRILEKKKKDNLSNLTIILGDAKNLLEYFNESSVKKLYLNFSDPWPKTRHHKRRLTYKPFLEKYKKLLKPNGILQLRTDHLGLFEDSLEYLDQDFDIFEANYNHIRTKYYTEYELKRLERGNIYQLKASVF